MANLDDELRAAVQACDDVPVTKTSPTGEGTTEHRRGGSVWLLVALLVMGGGTLTLLPSSAEDSARYAQCIVPDNFQDAADIDVPAVVTGTLTPAGHFEATHIQPQCPSKYEEAQRRGEAMPHASVQ